MTWLGATVLAVGVAACGPGQVDFELPAGTVAGDLKLETCSVATDQGEAAAECGIVVVEENRQRIASRLIGLPVVRVPSLAEDPAEPIFFLGGGPGQSNMGLVPPAALLETHDLVFVGYRGADGTVILDCPEVDKAIRARVGNLLSEDGLRGMSDAFGTCAERLVANGVDLDGYTIPEVVADMEMVRSVLGYEQIILESHSYGTRVAQIYGYMHPQTVLRSAMLSVNTPGRLVWEPDVLDAQIEYYGHLCAQDELCRSRTPDLAQTMRDVLDDLPERWLLIPIDRGKVKAATFVLLFNRETAAQVFDTYIAAAQGDAGGLALLSLAHDLTVPGSSVWGDLAAKAVSADLDPKRNYVVDMASPDTILGAPLSLLLWGAQTYSPWPTAPLPETLRRVHPSDVPTLLVSGSIDPSTPAEYATHELLPHLSAGTQVVLAEMGHLDDLWSLQPEALFHLLSTFYATGEVDDGMFAYEPMDFDPSVRFPLLAKVVVVVFAVGIMGVAAGTWAVARRLRRRPRAHRVGDAN